MVPDRWIFVRGLSREARHWGEFLETFQTKFSTTPICIDLPGTGAKWKENSPCSIEAIADRMEAEFLSVAKKSPVGIVAMSMGTLIAMEWLRRHPVRIAAWVFINPSLRSLSAPWHRLRFGALARLSSLLFSTSMEEREKRIVSIVSNRFECGKEVVASWIKIQRDRPIRKRTALCQLYAAATYDQKPPPIAHSLVLASERDRLVNPICSKALARALSATIAVHPTAGHDLTLDEPDWVVTKVSDWLASF